MSKNIDQKYQDLLLTILSSGYKYEDPNREGVIRTQIDSYTIDHKFEYGFPALTTKELAFDAAIGELLAFLSGSTDIRTLWAKGVNFWDKDFMNFHEYSPEDLNKIKSDHKAGKNLEDSKYDLGKIYPHQLRHWNGNVDQIQVVLDTLVNNPMATKKTVTMWNPSDLKSSCLSPCHFLVQFLVRPLEVWERSLLFKEIDYDSWYNMAKPSSIVDIMNSKSVPKYGLTIKFHMHSVDTFLGLPINLAYYGTMCEVFAKLSNMKPVGIIADLSNVHLYDNQIEVAKAQLARNPNKYPEVKLSISTKADYFINVCGGTGEGTNLNNTLNSLRVEDFSLEGYSSYPPLRVPMLTYSRKFK